jgi:peroxiredoxin
MTQFESRNDQIASAGVQLVFIAAQKREGIWKPARFLAKHPIASPYLLDEDRAVTKAYGVHHGFGKDAINIAHPATFVVGHDKIVRYIYLGANQLDRAPLDDVMNALRKA